MAADSSRPLLTLGMHRSGTSYLASLLQALGVFIGDELLGPQKGNPRGHFEQISLLAFHQKLIAARSSWADRAFDKDMLVCEPFTEPVTDEELARATACIAPLRRPGYWGWKEPRTCLFLGLWQRVLPDLSAVAIYRHPLEVQASLRRRDHWDLPLFPDQAMRAYATYNEAILQLPAQRCLVINANAAFADPAQLLRQLCTHFELSANQPVPEFHPEEFRQLAISRPLHRLCGLIFPRSANCFDRLQQVAAVPYRWQSRPDDALLDDCAERLEPLLRDLPAAGRAYFGPWLDAIADADPATVYEQYRGLARSVGAHVQRAIEWNQKAERVFAENEALAARFDALAAAFEQQRSELAKLHQLNREFHQLNQKIWGELTWTGNSWREQRQIIDRLTAENEQLRQRLAESGNLS